MTAPSARIEELGPSSRAYRDWLGHMDSFGRALNGAAFVLAVGVQIFPYLVGVNFPHDVSSAILVRPLSETNVFLTYFFSSFTAIHLTSDIMADETLYIDCSVSLCISVKESCSQLTVSKLTIVQIYLWRCEGLLAKIHSMNMADSGRG